MMTSCKSRRGIKVTDNWRIISAATSAATSVATFNITFAATFATTFAMTAVATSAATRLATFTATKFHCNFYHDFCPNFHCKFCCNFCANLTKFSRRSVTCPTLLRNGRTNYTMYFTWYNLSDHFKKHNGWFAQGLSKIWT